jgi:hypothetical protein
MVGVCVLTRETRMKTIGDFEVVNHGIENESYFQGCGTSWTPFENVATGVGGNTAEAIDDCLESIAQADFETEGMEKRILRELGRRCLPKRPAVKKRDAEYCYYYVSIRWNEGD